MRTTIKIAIAEDHELLRKGLVSIFEAEECIDVVFEASNGLEVFDTLKDCPIDILLLDLDMPVMNGVEVMRKLKVQCPEIKSVILSMHYSPDFILECLSVGAVGFLAKNTNVENIMEALESVHKFGFYVCKDNSMNFLENEMKKRDLSLPKEISSSIFKVLCSGTPFHHIAKDYEIPEEQIIKIWDMFLSDLKKSR